MKPNRKLSPGTKRVLDVPCETCKAVVGQACHARGVEASRRVSQFHKARIEAACAAIEQRQEAAPRPKQLAIGERVPERVPRIMFA
jgi:hypothetical protein